MSEFDKFLSQYINITPTQDPSKDLANKLQSKKDSLFGEETIPYMGSYDGDGLYNPLNALPDSTDKGYRLGRGINSGLSYDAPETSKSNAFLRGHPNVVKNIRKQAKAIDERDGLPLGTTTIQDVFKEGDASKEKFTNFVLDNTDDDGNITIKKFGKGAYGRTLFDVIGKDGKSYIEQNNNPTDNLGYSSRYNKTQHKIDRLKRKEIQLSKDKFIADNAIIPNTDNPINAVANIAYTLFSEGVQFANETASTPFDWIDKGIDKTYKGTNDRALYDSINKKEKRQEYLDSVYKEYSSKENPTKKELATLKRIEGSIKENTLTEEENKFNSSVKGYDFKLQDFSKDLKDFVGLTNNELKRWENLSSSEEIKKDLGTSNKKSLGFAKVALKDFKKKDYISGIENSLKGGSQFVGGVLDSIIENPEGALNIGAESAIASLALTKKGVVGTASMLSTMNTQYNDNLKTFKKDFNRDPTKNENGLIIGGSVVAAFIDKLGAEAIFKPKVFSTLGAKAQKTMYDKGVPDVVKGTVEQLAKKYKVSPLALMGGLATHGSKSMVTEGVTEGVQDYVNQLVSKKEISGQSILDNVALGAIGGLTQGQGTIAVQALSDKPDFKNTPEFKELKDKNLNNLKDKAPKAYDFITSKSKVDIEDAISSSSDIFESIPDISTGLSKYKTDGTVHTVDEVATTLNKARDAYQQGIKKGLSEKEAFKKVKESTIFNDLELNEAVTNNRLKDIKGQEALDLKLSDAYINTVKRSNEKLVPELVTHVNEAMAEYGLLEDSPEKKITNKKIKDAIKQISLLNSSKEEKSLVEVVTIKEDTPVNRIQEKIDNSINAVITRGASEKVTDKIDEIASNLPLETQEIVSNAIAYNNAKNAYMKATGRTVSSEPVSLSENPSIGDLMGSIVYESTQNNADAVNESIGKLKKLYTFEDIQNITTADKSSDITKQEMFDTALVLVESLSKKMNKDTQPSESVPDKAKESDTTPIKKEKIIPSKKYTAIVKDLLKSQKHITQNPKLNVVSRPVTEDGVKATDGTIKNVTDAFKKTQGNSIFSRGEDSLKLFHSEAGKNKLIDLLEVENKEEVKNTLNKVLDFTLEFNEIARKSIARGKTVSNKETEIQNTLNVFRDKGALPENFYNASSIVAQDFLANKALDTLNRDKDQVGKVLGYSNSDLELNVVTDLALEMLGNIGIPFEVVISELGQKITDQLAIGLADNVDGLLLEKLQHSLGTMVVVSLEKQGLIEVNTLKNEEFKKLSPKDDVKDINAIQKYVALKTEKDINGSPVKDRYGNAVVQEHIKERLEEVKSINNISPILFGLKLDTRNVSDTPIKAVPDKIKGKIAELTPLQQKAVIAKQEQEIIPLKERFELLKRIGSKRTFLKMQGFIEPTGTEDNPFPKYHISRRKGIEGKNRTLTKEFDLLSEHIKDRKGDYDTPFYIPYNVISNGRNMDISETITLQRSKMHRYMYGLTTFKTTVDKSNKEQMDQFLYTIRQTLGEDSINDNLEISKELRPLVDLINSDKEKFSKEDNNLFIDNIKSAHQFAAIQDLATYQAFEGSTFNYNVTGEADGITNGMITAILQMLPNNDPEVIKFLERGGIYTENSYGSYQDFKDQGNIDNYENFTSKINDYVSTLENVDMNKNGLNKILPNFWSEGNTITKEGRSFGKAFFMTIAYGAGLKASYAKLTEVTIDEIVRRLEENENVEQLNEGLSQVLGRTIQITQENRLSFTLSEKDKKMLHNLLENTYGKGIEGAINEILGEFVKNRNLITSSMNANQFISSILFDEKLKRKEEELKRRLSKREINTLLEEFRDVDDLHNVYATGESTSNKDALDVSKLSKKELDNKEAISATTLETPLETNKFFIDENENIRSIKTNIETLTTKVKSVVVARDIGQSFPIFNILFDSIIAAKRTIDKTTNGLDVFDDNIEGDTTAKDSATKYNKDYLEVNQAISMIKSVRERTLIMFETISNADRETQKLAKEEFFNTLPEDLNQELNSLNSKGYSNLSFKEKMRLKELKNDNRYKGSLKDDSGRVFRNSKEFLTFLAVKEEIITGNREQFFKTVTTVNQFVNNKAKYDTSNKEKSNTSRDSDIKGSPDKEGKKEEKYSLQNGKFEANKDQKNLIDITEKFLLKSDKNKLLIQGRGGTGKTSTIAKAISNVLENKNNRFDNVHLMTISHKAKDTLNDMSGILKKKSDLRVSVIASALFEKFDYDLNKKIKSKNYKRLLAEASSTIIVVDEVSMVDKESVKKLELLEKKGAKVIYMGDYHQIPPVNENSLLGDVYKEGLRTTDTQEFVELKKIERQSEGSGILDIANFYADKVDNIKTTSNDLMKKINKSKDVSLLNKNRTITFLVNKLKEGKSAIYIAYTNKEVAEVSEKIRNLYLSNAKENEYLEGDKLIAYNNIVGDESPKNSVEAIVKKVEAIKFDPDSFYFYIEENNDPYEKISWKNNNNVKFKKLTLEITSGVKKGELIDYIVPENLLKNMIIDYANGINNGDLTLQLLKEFNKYMEVKNTYNNSNVKLTRRHMELVKNSGLLFSYSYAITTHKSQGSTYENVGYHINKFSKDKNNLNYTGVTRASDTLVIVANTDNKKEPISIREDKETMSISEESDTRGSSEDVVDKSLFEASEAIELTPTSFQENFNRLGTNSRKNDSQSHKEHLQGVLDNLIKPLLKNNKDITVKIAEGTGETRAQIDGYREAYVERGVRAQQHLFEISDQEALVHEVLHPILHTNTNTRIKREFNSVRKEAVEYLESKAKDAGNRSHKNIRQYIAEELFIKKDREGNPLYLVDKDLERREALKFVDYTLYGNIEEFVVHGTANERLNNILKDVKIKNVNLSEKYKKAGTLKEKLSTILTALLDWYGQLRYSKHASADKALTQLMVEINEANVKRTSPVRSGVNYLNKAIKEKVIDKMVEPYMDWANGNILQTHSPNRIIRAISNTAALPAWIASPEWRERFNTHQIEVIKRKDNFMHSLVREILIDSEKNKPFIQTLRYSKGVLDNRIENIANITSKMIKDSFDPENLPNDDEWQAINTAVLETSLYKLVESRWTPTDIEKVLEDFGFLESAIITRINNIKNIFDKELASYYVGEAHSLGYRMATGQSNKFLGMANAHLIAKRENLSKDQVNLDGIVFDSEMNRERDIKLLEELAVLYSLKNISMSTKTITASFLKSERLRNVEINGMQQLMRMQKLHDEVSLEKNFGGDPRQTILGYTTEKYDSAIEMRIGTIYDKESFERDRFMLYKDLDGNSEAIPKDPNDPDQVKQYIYINKDSLKRANLTGSVMLNDLKGRGQSLKDQVKNGSVSDFLQADEIRDTYLANVRGKVFEENNKDINYLDPIFGENKTITIDKDKIKDELRSLRVEKSKIESSVARNNGEISERQINAIQNYDNQIEELKKTLRRSKKEQSSIVGFKYVMHKHNKAKILGKSDKAYQTIGRMMANIELKKEAPELNKIIVSQLKADYNLYYENDPSEYVEVSAKSEEKRIQEIYATLPKAMKDQIRKVFKGKDLVIRRELLDLVFGNRDPSLALWIEDKGNKHINNDNDPRLEGIRRRMEELNQEYLDKEDVSLASIYLEKISKLRAKENKILAKKGFNPSIIKLLMLLENAWAELVKKAKRVIVLLIPAVIKANTISNFISGIYNGVSAKDNMKGTVEGLTELFTYQQNNKDYMTLKLKLDSNKNIKNRDKLEIKLRQLKDDLEGSLVHELVQSGVYQTIAEDLDIDRGNPLLTTIGSFGSIGESIERNVKKGGEIIPEKLKNLAKQVLISPDTSFGKALANMTQYSDFIARYAMHKHNMENTDMTKEESIDKILEVFVSYTDPTSKGLQWANNMGFIMFSKFMLRVQKPLAKAVYNNPADVISVAIMEQIVGDMPEITDNLLTPSYLLSHFHFNDGQIENNLLEPNLFNYFGLTD